MSSLTETHTASNVYLSRLHQLAVHRGLQTDQMLALCGLSQADLDLPNHRIKTGSLAQFLQLIWDGTQDESMGLCDTLVPRGAFYMMGKLAIHEATLGRALKIGSRFYRMISPRYRIDVSVKSSVALVSFDIVDPVDDQHNLFSELTLMAWHRFASWLIAENVTMQQVHFPYSPPEQVAEYTYMFPGKLKFNQSFLGFSFHRSFLDRRTVQNSLGLRNFIQNCPQELFMQPKVDFSLAGELKTYLKNKLSERFPTIEQAAEAVHTTKRTLIRKLADEGTSYQQLKDDLRLERSTYLLSKDHVLSVGQVAEALGYSDAAVFARAFKSWTGLTPSEYRTEFSAPSSK